MRRLRSIVVGLLLIALVCAAVVVLRLPPPAELVFDNVRDGDRAALAANLRAEPRLVGWQDSLGYTPLHWAAALGDRAAADLLLAAGADPNARDLQGRTPLHFAAISRIASGNEVVGLLLARGAAVDAADARGFTPLELARNVGEAEVGRMLIAAGAKPQSDNETDTRLAAGPPSRRAAGRPGPVLRRWARRTTAAPL